MTQEKLAKIEHGIMSVCWIDSQESDPSEFNSSELSASRPGLTSGLNPGTKRKDFFQVSEQWFSKNIIDSP